MRAQESTSQEPFRRGHHVYVRAPTPILFPSEETQEEHVSETKRHFLARTALLLSLEEALPAAAVGSLQRVYLDASDPRRYLSPDAFVKIGAKSDSFDTWKIWERTAPDLAVEILSDPDRSEVDWSDRLVLYHASGISEVVRFDAANIVQPLRMWDRIQDDLVERLPGHPASRECVALGCWWVVVPSGDSLHLRLARDPDGKGLLPTPSEERDRLAKELAEERAARSLAEHERMLADEAIRESRATTEAHERERQAHERASADAAAEIERLHAEIARLRG